MLKEKKTVLQINSVVNTGSTGRIVEGIAEIALQNGWASYIAYGRTARMSISKLIRVGGLLALAIHGIQTRLFDRHGYGSKLATLKLINTIEAINPDIIHLHNIHGYYINIEILFSYLSASNKPLIWTLHDCWPFTGHCSYFDNIGCIKWKNLCFDCPQKSTYPASWWQDNSKKNYLKKKELFNGVNNLMIVSVSHWLAGLVKQSFLRKHDLRVINNGIDLNLFSPHKGENSIREKFGIGNGFMMLAVAYSWSDRKGLNDFIKLSKVIGNDCKIVLVGLNNAQAKKMPGSIIAIPRTENMLELVQLYSSAEVVLNLSYEETFGLTTVEGFACGTPSIVYNCTASPELITDATGFIVEKGDTQGLVNAIQTIKSKGKSNYSLACRERAQKLYNKNDRYTDYIELYESLLNSPKNPPRRIT